jgi:hypothetical protein
MADEISDFDLAISALEFDSLVDDSVRAAVGGLETTPHNRAIAYLTAKLADSGASVNVLAGLAATAIVRLAEQERKGRR